jgi:serine/threonine protein kinase
MELVEGPTLAARLAKGPLSVAEALAIFVRLFDSLGHAHERGVVHRDLKPANVLLAADGARLADFGIAHLDMAAVTRKTQLTRTDAIIGTFPYMSPEQRAGRAVDARSDLYSAGVMLYEALAGGRPEGACPPLHRRRADIRIPARADEVVRRLLQPEPAGRFATAGEARRALQAAFSPRGLARQPIAWAALSAIGLAAILVPRGRVPSPPPVSPSIPQKKVESPSPSPAGPQALKQVAGVEQVEQVANVEPPLGQGLKVSKGAVVPMGKSARVRGRAKTSTKMQESAKFKSDWIDDFGPSKK